MGQNVVRPSVHPPSHLPNMVSLTPAFAILALTYSCLAAPSVSELVRHESRRSLPLDWEPSYRAPADFVLPLRVALTQPNLDNIESLLLDVSHPESPNYGQHWSAAKVAEMFRPTSESISTVMEWLLSEGIDGSRIRLSKSGGWIEANVTVSEAELLLSTEYHVYNHGPTDTKHIACDSAYHLPEHVSKHVDIVTPTLHFDVKVKRGVEQGKRFDNNAVRPGDPGFGPVVPKTVGSIKVRRARCHVCTIAQLPYSRTSSTNWRTVTNTSLRFACGHSTTLSTFQWPLKRTALA